MRFRPAPHSPAPPLQHPGADTHCTAGTMMNGRVLKMEHTMMLTNKDRCRADGSLAMRERTRSASTTGRRWEKQMTRDGRWERTIRDRGYMQHGMRVTHCVVICLHQVIGKTKNKHNFWMRFFISADTAKIYQSVILSLVSSSIK